jgi:Ni,Fe-hydrogenase I large subunit
MAVLTVGPFNRVEGDLEVHLEIDAGRVTAARVNSTLFRGFEQILLGKAPSDALVITPRICGICSVSQSMAAAYALAELMGIERPLNGELATNLILANENLADHFTHFYLFFMPDFARDTYQDRPWHGSVARRFRAISGSAAAAAIPARAQFMQLLGTLAGKWPHTLTLQPGGSSRAVEEGERLRLLAVLHSFRRFLEQTLFGDSLEAIVDLKSPAQLEQWRQSRDPFSCDFATFLHVAADIGLDRIGRATDRFMSYGVYPVEGRPLFARGVWEGELRPLNPAAITEDLSHSWMKGHDAPVPPSQGVTQPDETKEGAYSWCKAPRLAGEVVEVGALARQVVDGHPLIRGLIAESGGNVRNRIIARLLEIARVLIEMEGWVKALVPGQPYCNTGTLPAEASAAGLTESARGSLGHWVHVSRGRILSYQIVAPTTWNFSPRDQHGIPGALEQALAGIPVGEGEREPVLVQHVVRSFDPCMVCTVH